MSGSRRSLEVKEAGVLFVFAVGVSVCCWRFSQRPCGTLRLDRLDLQPALLTGTTVGFMFPCAQSGKECGL